MICNNNVMLRETEELMMKNFNFKPQTFDLYKKALKDVEEVFESYDEIR